MCSSDLEGFTLFEDLIKDLREPNQMVRARARLAVAYMDQNKLPRAAKLLEEAEAVGRYLAARFEPGERVALWAPNRPE